MQRNFLLLCLAKATSRIIKFNKQIFNIFDFLDNKSTQDALNASFDKMG